MYPSREAIKNREKAEFEPVLKVNIDSGEIKVDKRAEKWGKHLGGNHQKGEGE